MTTSTNQTWREGWSEGDVLANGIRQHYYRIGADSEKPPLLLLRSRSAEAWPIQACPPELVSPTVPLTSPIRIANAPPSMLARPAMWPIATSPDAMLACSASTRSSWT